VCYHKKVWKYKMKDEFSKLDKNKEPEMERAEMF
jgi:hypothetical protein